MRAHYLPIIHLRNERPPQAFPPLPHYCIREFPIPQLQPCVKPVWFRHWHEMKPRTILQRFLEKEFQMSIWGKIIGGTAGFALGGPIGALVGVAAGHFIDRATARARLRSGDATAAIETKRQAFAVALIVLCAKMAKADGKVTRDEINAFKRIFRVPEHEMEQVGKIFNEARAESTGFEPYAEQIMEIFPQNQQVREELLAALFHIAQADGVIHEAETIYLKSVARIFEFDDHDFARIFSSHIGSDDADPYEILGIRSDVSDDEIKRVYRDLMRENHPDRLMAEGLPQEMIDVANEKVAHINNAYDRLVKLRGMK